MNQGKFSRFQADAGGKWLGDLRAYFAFIPLWLSISILVSPGFTEPQTFLFLLIANITALCCVTLLLLLLRITVFRNRRIKPVSLGVVLISGASIGGLKAAITTLMMWAFEPQFELANGLFARTIPTAFGGMWLLPIGAVLLGMRERYQIERDVLISETVQRATEKQLHKLDSPAPTLTGAAKEIDEFLEQTRIRLLAQPEDSRNSSQLLHNIIQNELRPLSHKIWKEEAEKYTDFTLRDLARMTIKEHNFSTLWILISYSLACLPLEISAAGIQEGVSRLAVQVVIAAAFFEIARRIRTRDFPAASIVYFGSIALAVTCTEFVCTALFGPLAGYNVFALNVVNGLTLTTNALIIGIVRFAYESHENIKTKLIEQIGQDGLTNAYVVNRNRLHHRELAHFLHGNLQNQMLAAALRLESAHSPEALNSVLAGLDDVQSLLYTNQKSNASTKPKTSSGMLFELSTKWNGIVEIFWETHPANIELNDEECTALQRVLNEAVTNSVRHGLASEIEIIIFAESRNIILKLHDDGLGPRNGSKGLGSALYDSLAGNNWVLNSGREGVGSVLDLSFSRFSTLQSKDSI